ncbi:peptidoglycan-binding domain-containing protein [Amycolatopsis sp. NPDC021455]|uniref:peptidoglycan-binding domain-containing protein n=1 Tax=Amycolatopsis sp. NPDC021455 TaxID=3154901 RepID=UPI0033D95A10
MQWRQAGRGATIGVLAAGMLAVSATAAFADIVRGNNGPAVRCVQHVVHSYNGISVGSSGEDGDFGGNTERAVKTYQGRKGIGVDGRVGPITGHVMFQDVQNLHQLAHHTGDTDLFTDTGRWLSTCPGASSVFQ